ncbi:MAG: hypothetical protein Q8Q35_01205 [Nanoarchaeota archaeon]|nr:hypothetical protein [Nanoarchaeota archaeon]
MKKSTLTYICGIGLAGGIAAYSLFDSSPRKEYQSGRSLTPEERLEVHREVIKGQEAIRDSLGDSVFYNGLIDAIR